MNPLDIARIATRGQRAAELLDRYGLIAARVAAAQGRSSIQATSYNEPTGSNNPDDYGADIPNDPTGATVVDNLTRDLLDLRFRSAVESYEQACGILTDLILTTVDVETVDNDTPDTDDDLAGWCRSCYRDAHHLEPEAHHTDGRLMYRASCRWCRLFEQHYKQPVPLTVLRARHTGQRVTPALVTGALRREARKRTR